MGILLQEASELASEAEKCLSEAEIGKRFGLAGLVAVDIRLYPFISPKSPISMPLLAKRKINLTRFITLYIFCLMFLPGIGLPAEVS